MKLEITNQTNEQECGVCAITSLHNYFYKDCLTKEQVLDKSRITYSGMSIFDFEVLAKQAGLESESYEVSYSEFVKLNINNYFVALVSTHNGLANHYVIVKKERKQILVYDSCSSDIQHLTYEQFKKIYLSVVILISKKPNKTFSKVFGNTRTLLLFDLKFVLLNLLISFLILCCSIAGASFLNWIIDLSILKGSINNLFTISFIFIFVYFSNDLLSYISSMLVVNQIKSYYLLFTNKILFALENKTSDFLLKVDRNWIYKIDECVYSISNFCILEINKLITNIIFSLICICVIGSLQPYLLIFIVLFSLIEFIPFLFSYRKKKGLFCQIVRTENKNTQYYKKLIQSLSHEMWPSKRRSLLGSIKNNYSNIYKNFNDATLFKSNNTLIKSLCKSFAEICLIACASYLIIKNKSLSIGKLTFVIATFSLFKTSTGDIFNYFLTKIEFDVYWQVYKDLTNVSNVQEAKSQSINNIKSIEFIWHKQTILLDSTKKINEINFSILNLISQSETIKVNDVIVNRDNKQFIENVIVVDQHSNPNIELFAELMNQQPELYAGYLRYFNIDINNELLSIEQSTIVNLLTLLAEKDKIIIIDSILEYVQEKDKMVLKEILNKIRNNNYLFIVGKENNDKTKH